MQSLYKSSLAKSKVSTLTLLSSYIRSLFIGHELSRVVVDEMTDHSLCLQIRVVPLSRLLKMKAWLSNNRVQFQNLYVKIALTTQLTCSSCYLVLDLLTSVSEIELYSLALQSHQNRQSANGFCEYSCYSVVIAIT